MLDHLRVANLGVIQDAAIDPSDGLTVVTGETGAGKTLLLGGLRLILGIQADAGAVGPYGDEARVDGLFETFDTEVGASRVVPAGGRSRAYLEGAIVSAATLSERLGSQVEIVGQHDQVTITRPARVLEVIDGALDDEGRTAREGYERAWKRLREALRRQEELGGDEIELSRELDLARYQASEISAANLASGLDEEIEARVSRLRNVEEITEHLIETVKLAEQMSEAVGEVVARLRKASGLDPALGSLATEADGLAAGVAEIAREARSTAEEVDADPALLEELEERLNALGDLKRKYGRTLEDVIEYGDETARRATELEELIADADRIDSIVTAAWSEVSSAARRLSAARHQTASRLAEEVERHLADLGLGSAKVGLELEPVDAGPSGADRAEITFASDSRLEPGPISSIASGGELSRLVLALRLATRSASVATLVFDEVDTGIGGKTALAMGAKLAQLASSGQVLCVTHLAQVAAHADTHYVVDRGEDGVARIRQVSGEDRVIELSRMLAGQPESDASKTAAAELLSLAGK
jgi:DNA repair protein RecN (Recombination protein N)